MEKFVKAETLRKKTNVTYEEAKEALEQNNWDLMDAMIHLEKTGAIKQDSRNSNRQAEDNKAYTTRKEPEKKSGTRDYVKQGEGLLKKAADWVARMINLGNTRQVVMRRNGQTIFEIPVTAAVLVALFISPIFWPAFFISLIMGCCYTITNREKDAQDIREAERAAEELNQRHQVNSFEF